MSQTEQHNHVPKLFHYLISPVQQHDPKSAFQCQHRQHTFLMNSGTPHIC